MGHRCEEDRLPVLRPLVRPPRLTRALGQGLPAAIHRARPGSGGHRYRWGVLPGPPRRRPAVHAVPADVGDRGDDLTNVGTRSATTRPPPGPDLSYGSTVAGGYNATVGWRRSWPRSPRTVRTCSRAQTDWRCTAALIWDAPGSMSTGHAAGGVGVRDERPWRPRQGRRLPATPPRPRMPRSTATFVLPGRAFGPTSSARGRRWVERSPSGGRSAARPRPAAESPQMPTDEVFESPGRCAQRPAAGDGQ